MPTYRDGAERPPFAVRQIPAGWSVAGWIDRLRYLARLCAEHDPDRAARLVDWADELEPYRLAAAGSAGPRSAPVESSGG